MIWLNWDTWGTAKRFQFDWKGKPVAYLTERRWWFSSKRFGWFVWTPFVFVKLNFYDNQIVDPPTSPIENQEEI